MIPSASKNRQRGHVGVNTILGAVKGMKQSLLNTDTVAENIHKNLTYHQLWRIKIVLMKRTKGLRTPSLEQNHIELSLFTRGIDRRNH
ncbi:hypothetical protein E2C01_012783 [Portunus trituberculatus]|uniref:Uncharacterized protein n=1 Tax=Portunus trituberculatus TaxID=210409 RepID=A0A5B7DEI1_PORTR|nr:hypothetical protein [Portunus trituberculatus]